MRMFAWRDLHWFSVKRVQLSPRHDSTLLSWNYFSSPFLVSLLLQMFLSELLQWGVRSVPSSPLLCNNVQHVLCSAERTASHLSTSALSESAEPFFKLSVGFCHLLKTPGWYTSAAKLKNDSYTVKQTSEPVFYSVSLCTASSDLSLFLISSYNASAG